MTHRLRFFFATLVILLAASTSGSAQSRPNLSETDRIRLAEAFQIADKLGDRVWKDLSKAPFAVLLVTREHEFLIRHPNPSNDFTLIGNDATLKSDIYFRKRRFDPNLLATFPAVGGVSTIVIGQAENTSSKTSTPWVITVLHEHFHQLQDSQPNSYAETLALGLARGDQSGMWMLNYPFPYDSDDVGQKFSLMGRLLVAAMQSKPKDELSRNLTAYLQARAELRQLLSVDDYKYLSFQLWKEGLARYTEYRIAQLAATAYKPSKEFQALKDFTAFPQVADQIRNEIIKSLSAMNLKESRRVAFYAWGAAEGLLLDRVNPNWQSQYFVEKFSLDKYFLNQGRSNSSERKGG
jgi:hypothetical protein